MKKVLVFLLAMCFISTVFAQGAPDKAPAKKEKAKPMYGWRGNFTGLFPDANPPVEFHRLPKGVTAGMTCQAEKPKELSKKSGVPLSKGLPVEWLAVGPFSVSSVGAEFDKELLPGEAKLSPDIDEKAKDLKWAKIGPTPSDGINIEAVYLSKDPQRSQVAYGFTYLWSDKDGKAEAVVEHIHGFKMWVNGKQVYSALKAVTGFGGMYQFSYCKADLSFPQGASIIFDVKKGWNRMLVKQCTTDQSEWQVTRFIMRLADYPREYDDKNILWTALMPDRTNASPIIIGDKVFTVSEPDELYCLDKNTGKVLWRTFNSFYETVPQDKRKSKDYADLEKLQQELYKTTDPVKSVELKFKVLDGLKKIDKATYDVPWDGHMRAHFGIVGFTTQPVSDGKNICVFFGNGVVACYDLNGYRKWINKIQIDMYVYPNSPVISNNKVVVTCCGYGTIKNEHAAAWIYAFDMDTGKLAWINKTAWGGIASLIPAKLAGQEVVITQRGDILRASDGFTLFNNPHKIPNDTGWAQAVVDKDIVYMPWGSFSVYIWDFENVKGDTWSPFESSLGKMSENKDAKGQWRDDWNAASGLLYKDIAYFQDIHGTFYAADLKSKSRIYLQQLEYEPYDSYDHLGCSSSPALCGKNIYVMDNQGVCYVIAPGKKFKIVAKNLLFTQPTRDKWGVPMREFVTNGSIVADGNRLYIRGQENLYCIGEK